MKWISLTILQGKSSYQRTIKVIQWHNKLNIGKVLDKYKIFPKNKARMSIPLCWHLFMRIVRPTLKIDVLKMEQVFFMRYCKREKAFYISSKNSKGEEEFVNKYMPSWSIIWTCKNAKFEKYLLEDLYLFWLCGKMFHIWDGNHCLQTWSLTFIWIIMMRRICTSLLMPLFWIPQMA